MNGSSPRWHGWFLPDIAEALLVNLIVYAVLGFTLSLYFTAAFLQGYGLLLPLYDDKSRSLPPQRSRGHSALPIYNISVSICL
jgi:hypothetical protein